jgi:hypothetical protein|tara:strand:+ start:11126 stop:11323 length:198 start_codon:yes stop_codon:yes gene_type:complete
MTTADLLQRIKKNLERERLAIAEKMVLGRNTDFLSYQKDVGIAEGLSQASDIISETMKKINEEDA